MREFIYEVPPADDGMLLQDYLKCRQGYSRRLIIDLKKSGISVNGEHRRMVDPVRGGDIIRIVLGELDETNLIPNPDLRADILYEDEDVVAFDKPADMSVHPCALYYNDTLGNLFAARYPGLTFRPLYRLDRDTTGICVSAKNTFAASVLMGHLEKTYYAVAEGLLADDEGTVDAPLIRVPGSIITRKVDPAGQRAVTHYKVFFRSNGHTLLALKLETGRTHQIRVHLSYLGHPLAGDTLYGGHDDLIGRQALHCGELFLPALPGRTEMVIRSPLPEDMQKLL
ncbi:MAG: RluA family pseudouridine synthase [Oscillospiraceae bacterium]|nr:RluA family pseudouridine synthase [Oscillospiraceae bacterium]